MCARRGLQVALLQVGPPGETSWRAMKLPFGLAAARPFLSRTIPFIGNRSVPALAMREIGSFAAYCAPN
jgi:hypothetical protein